MSFPAGGRIVLDPDDLRQLATRMRGASLILSLAGRDVATRPLPAMSTGVAAAVTEVICRANKELQDLAGDLLQEAEALFARATWAELGGGEAIAWLIPGLHHAASTAPGASAAAPVTPASALPPVSEQQLVRSEQWAITLLNEMEDPLQVLDDQAAKLGDEVDDVFGAELVKFADEIPVKTLGAFTMAAGAALDVYEHREEGIPEARGRAGVSAGAGAAGGALRVAFCEAALGWTGVGLAGCLLVGGALGSWSGDQLGEEVLE